MLPKLDLKRIERGSMMLNKIWMPALLIMMLALVPCLADTPAWASADHSNNQDGDFTLYFEFARDDNPNQYSRPPQFLEEGNVLLGRDDATDADQDDFILASKQDAQTRGLPASSACVELSPVGHVGTLYLQIARKNGPCEVDLENVKYFLNDPRCRATKPCGDNPTPGIPCLFPSPGKFDCNNEETSGPCIDSSSVEAKANVICTPENATCNECINWETGSPICTDYRTSNGVRIKNCIIEETGKTCPWRRCCKRGETNHHKCKP
jgi:hypothetical protein